MAALIGGPFSFAGPIVGAVVYLGLKEVIVRFTEYWLLVFGLVLLGLVLASAAALHRLSRSPLGLALREANRLAALYALAPTGHRPAAAVPGWATLAKPVQDCYLALGRTA